MTVTKDGTLQEEERGYYSLGDGYAFLLPPNWQTEVTVQNDNLTGDLVFYHYMGDRAAEMPELMRISVATDTAKSGQPTGRGLSAAVFERKCVLFYQSTGEQHR